MDAALPEQAPDSSTLQKPIYAWLAPYMAAWLLVFIAGLGLGHLPQVSGEPRSDGLDQLAWTHVVESRENLPALTRVFRIASRAGDAIYAVPFVIVMAIGIAVLGSQGRLGLARSDAAYFLGVALGGSLLTESLKAFLDRARPIELQRLVEVGSSSFPSGHALNAACVAVAAATVLVPLLRRLPVWGGLSVVLILSAVPPIIAASRVWLAVHYLSDVVAGLALGAGWAGLAAMVRNRWAVPRRSEVSGIAEASDADRHSLRHP